VLTPSTRGKIHDQKIHDHAVPAYADREDIIGGIPDLITVLVDSGFQGVQKQYVNIRLPHKKPRGGELAPQQKADATDIPLHGISHAHQAQENRELAQERVICENAFSGVKRYNAVSDIYPKGYTSLSESSV
jgi:hypothetical protein